jgi:hypothetical protein
MPTRDELMLMHAVLDGEATPADRARLDKLVAADPAARLEYEDLRQLFDTLRRVPERDPPQLSAQYGVSSLETNQDKGESSMSQTTKTSNRRNVLIGISLAVIAALGAGHYIFGIPGGQDTAGTIAPAQRYRAPQPTGTDVQGSPTVGQQPSQPGGSSSVNAGSANQVNANQGGANAGSANQVVNQGGVNAVSANQGNANQGGVNAVSANQGNANQVKMNQGGGQWSGATANQGTANQVVNQGSANQAVNQGNANQAVNQGKANQVVNQGGVNQGNANQGNANQGNVNQGNVNQAVQK